MAKKTTEEQKNFILTGMSIANVRRLSEKVVAFSLLGNGLGLYNLRVVEGQKGNFVAAPQEKGKDGKYYNEYALYLTKEDEAKVIKKVLETAPAPKKEESGSDF